MWSNPLPHPWESDWLGCADLYVDAWGCAEHDPFPVSKC